MSTRRLRVMLSAVFALTGVTLTVAPVGGRLVVPHRQQHVQLLAAAGAAAAARTTDHEHVGHPHDLEGFSEWKRMFCTKPRAQWFGVPPVPVPPRLGRNAKENKLIEKKAAEAFKKREAAYTAKLKRAHPINYLNFDADNTCATVAPQAAGVYEWALGNSQTHQQIVYIGKGESLVERCGKYMANGVTFGSHIKEKFLHALTAGVCFWYRWKATDAFDAPPSKADVEETRLIFAYRRLDTQPPVYAWNSQKIGLLSDDIKANEEAVGVWEVKTAQLKAWPELVKALNKARTDLAQFARAAARPAAAADPANLQHIVGIYKTMYDDLRKWVDGATDKTAVAAAAAKKSAEVVAAAADAVAAAVKAKPRGGARGGDIAATKVYGSAGAPAIDAAAAKKSVMSSTPSATHAGDGGGGDVKGFNAAKTPGGGSAGSPAAGPRPSSFDANVGLSKPVVGGAAVGADASDAKVRRQPKADPAIPLRVSLPRKAKKGARGQEPAK